VGHRFARQNIFYHAAHALGTKVLSIDADHRLTLAPEDLPIAAGSRSKCAARASQRGCDRRSGDRGDPGRMRRATGILPAIVLPGSCPFVR
jgi:hypothetical protein